MRCKDVCKSLNCSLGTAIVKYGHCRDGCFSLVAVANRKKSTHRSGPRCRHCGKKVSCRPRGLCWTCYHVPNIVRLYPFGGEHPQYAHKGSGLDCEEPKEPMLPTDAMPGSEAKIQVLRRRAARGEFLFHRADRTFNLR